MIMKQMTLRLVNEHGICNSYHLDDCLLDVLRLQTNTKTFVWQVLKILFVGFLKDAASLVAYQNCAMHYITSCLE